MSQYISPEVMSVTTQAVNIANDFRKAQAAASALLRLTVDNAITALEAQSGGHNVASALHIRTIHFEGVGIPCVYRVWKLKWDLYMIVGLNGFITPTGGKAEGRFIPFENCLPKLADHGVEYSDLVAAVAELHERATQVRVRTGDGQEN